MFGSDKYYDNLFGSSGSQRRKRDLKKTYEGLEGFPGSLGNDQGKASDESNSNNFGGHELWKWTQRSDNEWQ